LHVIIFSSLAVGMTDLSSNIIKELTARPRPKEALPGVYYLDRGQWSQQSHDFTQTKMYGGSMPSSHAANSMAAAVVICAIAPPLAPIAVGVSIISGYSRIYRARHYPSDVLIGWLLGLLMGWSTVRFRSIALRRLEAWRQKKRPALKMSGSAIISVQPASRSPALAKAVSGLGPERSWGAAGEQDIEPFPPRDATFPAAAP